MIATSPQTGTNGRIKRTNMGNANVSEPVQRASERSRVANREWFPALCTTGANEPDRTFHRFVDRPLMFCIELDGVVEAQPRFSAEGLPATERLAVFDRVRFRGLCMTCEKRETCTFPKPEGGVFHCEEFE